MIIDCQLFPILTWNMHCTRRWGSRKGGWSWLRQDLCGNRRQWISTWIHVLYTLYMHVQTYIPGIITTQMELQYPRLQISYIMPQYTVVKGCHNYIQDIPVCLATCKAHHIRTHQSQSTPKYSTQWSLSQVIVFKLHIKGTHACCTQTFVRLPDLTRFADQITFPSHYTSNCYNTFLKCVYRTYW